MNLPPHNPADVFVDLFDLDVIDQYRREEESYRRDMEVNREVDALTDPESELSMQRVTTAVMVSVILQAPETFAVVRKLDRAFRRMRQKLLGRVYAARCSLNDGRLLEDQTRSQFIRKAGTGHEMLDNTFSTSFFLETILPLIAGMADSAEELDRIGRVAIDCVPQLMALDTHVGTQKSMHRGLMRSFFAPCEAVGSSSYYGAHSQGHFQYFYERWGGPTTVALAWHQGVLSDYHFDGGDYSESAYQIVRRFGPVFDELSPRFRDQAARVFLAQDSGHDARDWLERAPGIIDHFVEAGEERLLSAYFRIAEGCPDLNKGSYAFPFDEPEKLLEELQAWDRLPEFKEEALIFAREVIRHNGGYYESRELTFLEKPFTTESSLTWISIPSLIQHLRADGCSSRKIRSLLRFPARHAWMGKASVLMVAHQRQLSESFPGGLKGLKQFLRRPGADQKALLACVERLVKSSSPVGDKEARYLEFAGAFLERGAVARGFFHSWNAPFEQFCLEEPEAAQLLIDQVDALLTPCPAVLRYQVEELVWDAVLKHFKEEHFGGYWEGLVGLIGDAYQLHDWDRARVDYSTREMISSSVRRYVHELPYIFSQAAASVQSGFHGQLDYPFEAKVVAELEFRQGGPCRPRYHDKYCYLVRNGWNRAVAATVAAALSPEREGFRIPLVRKPEGVEVPIPVDQLQHMVDGIRTLEGKAEAFILQPMGLRAKMEGLADFEKSAQELCLGHIDPELHDLIKLETVLDLAKPRKEISLQLFRQKFYLGTGSAMDLPSSRLLEEGGAVSQMIVSAATFLGAIGAVSIPGLETRDLERLDSPSLFLPSPGADVSNALAHLEDRENIVRRNIAKLLPRVEQLIVNARLRRVGFMPVGGKTHTLGAMDEQLLDSVKRLFQLGSTQFRLIHAGGSLLLPPMATGFEMQLLMMVLEAFGVTDRNYPELQLGMAGRCTPERVGILGAGMLLGTRKAQRYDGESFSTTHNHQTGMRMFAYDAGVRYKEGIIFDLDTRIDGRDGRIDKLGGRDPEDADLYQILGNFASHEQFDGPLGDQFEIFRRHLRRCLMGLNLDEELSRSPWIYDHVRVSDSPQEHLQMVNAFVDARDARVVEEVRRLIVQRVSAVRPYQQHLIDAQPEKVEKFLYS